LHFILLTEKRAWQLDPVDQDHLQHVVTQRAEDHRHHCPNHGHCTIFPPDGVVGEKPDPRTIHRTDRHGEECLRQRQIDESAVLRRICTDVHQFLRSNKRLPIKRRFAIYHTTLYFTNNQPYLKYFFEFSLTSFIKISVVFFSCFFSCLFFTCLSFRI